MLFPSNFDGTMVMVSAGRRKYDQAEWNTFLVCLRNRLQTTRFLENIGEAGGSKSRVNLAFIGSRSPMVEWTRSSRPWPRKKKKREKEKERNLCLKNLFRLPSFSTGRWIRNSRHRFQNANELTMLARIDGGNWFFFFKKKKEGRYFLVFTSPWEIFNH